MFRVDAKPKTDLNSSVFMQKQINMNEAFNFSFENGTTNRPFRNLEERTRESAAHFDSLGNSRK